MVVTEEELEHIWPVLYERDLDNRIALRRGEEPPYLKECSKRFIETFESKEDVKDAGESLRHSAMVMRKLKDLFPPTSSMASKLVDSISMIERVTTFVDNIEDAVQPCRYICFEAGCQSPEE